MKGGHNIKNFSKKEIIITSWKIMVPHLALMVIIILFIFSLNIVLSLIQDRLLGEITAQTIMFIISASLFQMGLNLGLLRICINIINNEEVKFSYLFGSFHMLISYVLATIVYLAALIISASPGIILLITTATSDLTSLSGNNIMSSGSTVFGILLIIVPVVYLSVRLQFYDYFLIDENCNAIESIIKSAHISKGYVLELFILGAIISIIILVSIIPFGAGLIISVPFASMVTSYIYVKLKKHS